MPTLSHVAIISEAHVISLGGFPSHSHGRFSLVVSLSHQGNYLDVIVPPVLLVHGVAEPFQ